MSFGAVPARIELYFKIIDVYVSEAKKSSDATRLYIEQDPVWDTHRWAGELLEKLYTEIIKHNPKAERGALRQADISASGHCDWHRKLSLYCAEIAEGTRKYVQ